MLCLIKGQVSSPLPPEAKLELGALLLLIGLSSPCRDFAFVASDKDTCVLKCHVFHCNVPGKAIAKALHEMCSKVSLLTCSTVLYIDT